MDYLQEAIQKAREQGKSGIGRTPSPGEKMTRVSLPVSGATTQPSSRDVGKAPVGELPSPSEIKYTRTRQVELDSGVLALNRVIAGSVSDPQVEAYRQLRSHVLTAMDRNGWNTLAITSPQEAVGKTTTSVNLAISISREMNHTVLLVALDLRKPRVAATLGLEIDKGIVDHLTVGEPIENILLNPATFPRFVVLPGMPQGKHVSELLSSPEMKAFMMEATKRYPDRIIMFDLPPLLRNDDAMVFVPNVDACLLVVEDGATTPGDLERSLDLLKDAELLGTVLNKAR